MRRQFERYPKYEMLYRRSAQKLFDKMKSKGKTMRINGVEAKNGDDIFDWWINIR